MARFDWYQATVPAPLPVLLGALSDLSSGKWDNSGRAPQGYGMKHRFDDADGVVCQVWSGGTHEHPHVVFSGETAPAGADLLRSSFEGHRVTRADVCIDYAEPGAYDRLQELALSVARERRIKVGTAGDHLLTKEGRTLYLGSTASHTRLRIYDKAAELRVKYQAQLHKLAELPAELARFECQVRPQTFESKCAAAVADPVSLMGSAAWMRELVRLVSGTELEPFQAARPWRQADDDRAYAALLAQYGGMLRRRVVDHGSWSALGAQIGGDLAERESWLSRR